MRLPSVRAQRAGVAAALALILVPAAACAGDRAVVTSAPPPLPPVASSGASSASGSPSVAGGDASRTNPRTPRTTRPTSTGPTAASPSPTAARAGRSFTVLGSGDVLLHQAFWPQAQRDARAAGHTGYDFSPLFASVEPAVAAADLAICHMETPYGPPAGPFSNFPLFAVPPQVAPALAAAGYDSCSTASNHAIDQGERGVDRTLDALDAAGIRHAGTARSAEEARQINLLTVNSVVVAHLSYTFSFNGLVRPKGKEWLANYLRADAVLADAKRAKRAGANVVIVSIHWGTEYQHAPNSQQTTLAKRLLASPDIDLILGHHTHVVQPLERIGDKWVAYGMGNEVAWQNFSDDTTDGIMPRFTFTEVSPGVFRVTAVSVLALHMWLDTKPTRLYDIASVLASPTASPALKRACAASLARTKRVLGQRGGFQAGMVLEGA